MPSAHPGVSRFYYNGDEHTFGQAYADGKIRNFMWTWNRATQQYEEFDGLLGEGTITPGQGFWVRALDDVEVRVPPEPGAGGLNGIGLPGPTAGWTVTLRLVSSSGTASARFGHNLQASEGFDRFDAEHLTSPTAPPVQIAFPHSNWGHYSASYIRDFRKSKSSDEWRVELNSQAGGQATLEWSGPEWVLARSVLVNEATGDVMPVARFRNGYALTLQPGTTVIRWRFGSDSARTGR